MTDRSRNPRYANRYVQCSILRRQRQLSNEKPLEQYEYPLRKNKTQIVIAMCIRAQYPPIRHLNGNILLMSTNALLLVNHGSSALLINHIPNGAIGIMIADLRLTETIQLLRADSIQVDGEGESNEEPD